MRKQLFKEIQAELFSILIQEDVSLIKHIDLWNNQVQDAQESEIFDTPAIFIEFNKIDWHSIGNKAQQGDASITLHIVTTKNSSSSSDSPFQDQELDLLDLPDKIFINLQNFKPTNCSYLTRADTLFDNSHRELQDTKETYQFSMLNTLASQPSTSLGFTLKTTRE